MRYCRVKVKTQKGVRTMWGKDFKTNGTAFTFKKCKTDGDEWFGNGSELMIISGRGNDLIGVKEAKINLVFGILEIVENE